jgi:predicted nucleotidyltransferase
MSHPEIIENCKKIIIRYLLDEIGPKNLVSVILYGSVARNEESYKYVNGKLYLESDIDVIVVVRNRIVVIKTWLGLKRLCNFISDELRKNWLLSSVNISIRTEERILNARPNAFDLHLKLNGKVIFGKELIRLMPHFEYKDIMVPSLCSMIFCHMTILVRTIVVSGILEGKKNSHGCNSVLKSIRKLTLFMIRAIIIKRSMPLNPYDLIEIKAKGRFYQIKDSAIFNDLLKSYDDIKLSDSNEECSMTEIERCLVRVIRQFNLTIAILTGINYPFSSLPKKLIFGQNPFTQRLRYGLQWGTFILFTNLHTGWSIDLFKLIIFTTLHPEGISLRFYNLFISSSNLVKSLNGEFIANDQQRQSWLKLYNDSLHPWKYSLVTHA